MLILLNIKYPLYWNKRKAIWLLRITWIVGVLLAVLICLLTYYTDYVWEDTFFNYFYPTLEITFIILAISTYGFIFHKFAKTRTLPVHTHGSQRRSLFQIFRASRFYISVWLILTFLLFMVVPDLTYLGVNVAYGYVPEVLKICIFISYAISNIVDAVIYIFMEPRVRKVLVRKLWITTENRVDTSHSVAIASAWTTF